MFQLRLEHCRWLVRNLQRLWGSVEVDLSWAVRLRFLRPRSQNWTVSSPPLRIFSAAQSTTWSKATSPSDLAELTHMTRDNWGCDLGLLAIQNQGKQEFPSASECYIQCRIPWFTVHAALYDMCLINRFDRMKTHWLTSIKNISSSFIWHLIITTVTPVPEAFSTYLTSHRNSWIPNYSSLSFQQVWCLRSGIDLPFRMGITYVMHIGAW